MVNDGGIQFASLVEQEPDLLNKKDLIEILKDDRLNLQIALQLLKLFGEPLSIENQKFSDEIAVAIINEYFSEDDIEWILENFDSLSETVQNAIKRYARGMPAKT